MQGFEPQVSRGPRANPHIRDGHAYIAQIQAISGQRGHMQTFRAACKLRDAGMRPDEALDALRTWNTTNAKPPWTAQELSHKVRDAFKACR